MSTRQEICILGTLVNQEGTYMTVLQDSKTNRLEGLNCPCYFLDKEQILPVSSGFLFVHRYCNCIKHVRESQIPTK